jgi:DNA adenine methylase
VTLGELRAPFPYNGSKSSIADAVWSAIGDVGCYVEPFCGSAAVLLARPPFRGTETINDVNGFVSNFWRAVSRDPEAVAQHAEWPVLENDLHARHRWLWAQRDDLRERLESDPEWFDAKVAGWWVWGISAFFAGAWCVGVPRRSKPQVEAGFVGHAIHGITYNVREQFAALYERFRRVRVLCGDWQRAVTDVAITIPGDRGITGIFLDPPYAHDGLDDRVYGENGSTDVFDAVVKWATENANDRRRIVLCGYDSRPMPSGWSEVPWKGHGGYGRRAESNQNRHRERLWLSPHCLDATRQLSLFGGAP